MAQGGVRADRRLKMSRTQENTARKNRQDKTAVMSSVELAHLGQGSVAYLRKVTSDDLRERFPGMDEINPGLELWALFSANGQPILLSDARDRALAGAMENDLVTVAIH